LLPLRGDLEESMQQNEYLADFLTTNPTIIIGAEGQRFEKIMLIIGEVLNKKYVKDETGLKLIHFVKQVASDTTMSQHFKQIFDNKMNEESQKNIT